MSRALLQQEARQRFNSVSDVEIDERLTKLMEQAGGEDQFYANIGMPFKDETLIRGNVADGVRMDKMLKEIYEPEPEATEEELHSYYRANLPRYMTDEEVRVSHVSVNLSGAQTRMEVYNKLREVRKKALEGADFDALGQEHSSSKDQPSDLGWFKRGEFMEEFESIAFSMNEGEISPVFTTQLGFHLCKVTGRKPPVPVPFSEVRDRVKHAFLEEYRDSKFNTFVDDLKAKADVQDTDPDGDYSDGGH